jgi:hypothetical protein
MNLGTGSTMWHCEATVFKPSKVLCTFDCSGGSQPFNTPFFSLADCVVQEMRLAFGCYPATMNGSL